MTDPTPEQRGAMRTLAESLNAPPGKWSQISFFVKPQTPGLEGQAVRHLVCLPINNPRHEPK